MSSTPQTPAGPLRWILIGLVAPVLFAAAGLLLITSWLGDLPARVATHWPAGGVPDDFGSVGTYFVLLPAVVVPFSVLMSVLAVRSASEGGRNPRLFVAFSAGLSVFMTVALTAAVGIQRGLSDGREAGDPGGFIVAGAGAGLVVAVVIFLLVPAPPAATSGSPAQAPTLDLAPAERAYWTRTVSASRVLLVVMASLGAVLLLVAIRVLATTGSGSGWSALIAPVLLLAACLTMLRWRVTIDESGFTARSLIGLHRFHVRQSRCCSRQCPRPPGPLRLPVPRWIPRWHRAR